MKIPKYAQNTPVYIRWHDAWSAHGDISADDLTTIADDNYVVEDVGMFLRADNNYVTIARSYHADMGFWRCVVNIPVGMIQEVLPLRLINEETNEN